MDSKLSVAREIAYDAFVAVMENRQAPELVSEALMNQQAHPLKRIDRNLVKEILFGGLRWYSKIHWIIQKTSKRDLAKTSPEIRAALILGAYQIFYMDRIPDRAAVNESVEYVRKKGQAKAVTFVNGILRSIARRAEYFSKPDKEKHPCEFLALQYAHPRWIVDRWHKRFSFDRLKELLVSNNQAPPYSIRVNALKVTLETMQDFRSDLLRDDKNKSERQPLRSCLALANSPRTDADSYFGRGYYTIQDEASQLVSNMLAPKKGDFVVDACAGKGGKTGHLYELSHGEATIVGVEKDAKQVELAGEAMTRLGHTSVSFITEDFLNYQPAQPVDRILLDAPCSGLGVLRRHPEGKWHKTVGIIPAMAATQRKLIEHALKILRPGGEMVFSVCSFEPEETLDHMSWIHNHYGDTIQIVSPVSRIPDYYNRFVTREDALLIFSGNKDGMDGFGAFIVKRIS